MAVVTLKSLGITNLDASPYIPQTTGEGAVAREHIANDQLTVGSGDSIGSIYRMVRIPTNAKIKRVDLFSAVATGGSADIDVAFSDSLIDGTQAILQGQIVQFTGPVDNKLFGVGQSIVSTLAAGPLTKTFANTFTPAHQNLPLWQVLINLGVVSPTLFAFDPGGFFDIVLKVTTGITTGGVVSMEVRYAM